MTLKQEGINKQQAKVIFGCQMSVLNFQKGAQNFVQKLNFEIPKKGSPSILLIFWYFLALWISYTSWENWSGPIITLADIDLLFVLGTGLFVPQGRPARRSSAENRLYLQRGGWRCTGRCALLHSVLIDREKGINEMFSTSEVCMNVWYSELHEWTL